MAAGEKPKDENDADYAPSHPIPLTSSPNSKHFELEEHIDIVKDYDDACGTSGKENSIKRKFDSAIDVNLTHPVEIDDEIAEVDVTDDETDKGSNAAEALRSLVNAEARKEQTSSASSSSESGSGSESESESESSSRSRDSGSSAGDSLNCI
nr:uncharacterized protein LOC111993107 [Quercus suber]